MLGPAAGSRTRNLCWESFSRDRSSATWFPKLHLAVLIPNPAPSLSLCRGDIESKELPRAQPHEGFGHAQLPAKPCPALSGTGTAILAAARGCAHR